MKGKVGSRSHKRFCEGACEGEPSAKRAKASGDSCEGREIKKCIARGGGKKCNEEGGDNTPPPPRIGA